ncbi:MAG: type II secretion system F family protein [Chitinispirillia bacterium]|nr:type II secretion system F family protein [Chitinispirillia bacterium]MCL2241694.1 type II secretion system F family protein [Chitinispirillia bacterium]
MPKFSYSVRDAQGRLVSGTMDGNSVDECIVRLEEKNLIPINIEELNFDGSIKGRSFFDKVNGSLIAMSKRVPYRDVVFFTRQLATMIDGGVALPRAVEQLSRNEKPAFKRMLEQIGDDLGMGSTFSDALGKHPGAFNNMFVAVVRAGEAAGALDKVLDQLANYMENSEALKSKVKAAMRYPAVITAFVAAVTVGILTFLVPVFKDMYAGFGAKLPAATLMMISFSDAIRDNAIAVTAGIIALVIGGFLALNAEKPKYLWDRYLLKLPVFGEILRKNILAIFCRTMSLLMDSGTPILEAIQISGAAVNNKHYSKALEGVYNDIKQGELLSASLVKAGHADFPALVTQLVSTGEESGRIDELLSKAAEFYDREIKNVVDSLSSIIEPILIVILGGIVGTMLIALYLPVFTIGKIIK